MDDVDRRVADPIGPVAADPTLRSAFDGAVTVIGSVRHRDSRGRLAAVDTENLPFAVRRVFTVSGVPAGTIRGRHRHRHGSQALFCVTGRVDVGLRRGSTAHAPVTLTPDGPGLCVSGGVWSEQRYVLEGSSLLVLASEPYDPDSYESEA